jgi:proteasome lid subunit RPN8/RPN11
MALSFAPEALDTVHAHAQEGYPEEVVGILAGNRTTGRITAAVPLANERRDRRVDRYEVSGLRLLRAEQAIADTGSEVVGYYHSHPEHPATYSAFDRDHAMPNMAYVIVAVQQAAVVDTRAWRLREDRTEMDEEPIDVKE